MKNFSRDSRGSPIGPVDHALSAIPREPREAFPELPKFSPPGQPAEDARRKPHRKALRQSFSPCALFAIIAIYALARRTAMPIDNPGVDGGGTPKLRALTAAELLAADIPERRTILDPILSTKSLV